MEKTDEQSYEMIFFRGPATVHGFYPKTGLAYLGGKSVTNLLSFLGSAKERQIVASSRFSDPLALCIRLADSRLSFRIGD